MRRSNRLVQTFMNTSDPFEEKIVGAVLMSLQQGTPYARDLYESGEAGRVLSAECLQALKEALENNEVGRRGDPNEEFRITREMLNRQRNQLPPLLIINDSSESDDDDVKIESVASNSIHSSGSKKASCSVRGKSSADSEESVCCSSTKHAHLPDDPVLAGWLRIKNSKRHKWIQKWC